MTKIHPTAQVHPKSEIAGDVEIGPYSIITENVKIGPGTRISHHVTVTGHTVLGKNNIIFPYAALGTAPQDLIYHGEDTSLKIGDGNTIREFVTINLGTYKEQGETVIGSHNFLMAYCHIAHDCILRNNIVMANGVQLGGHVKIEDFAAFGGLVGIHHFVTIGQHSFIGGLTRVIQDVPPFMIVEGHPARVRAVNTIGLTRRGFSEEKIQALKNAYKLIWHSKHTKREVLKILEQEMIQFEEIGVLVQFLRDMQKGRQGRTRETLRKIPVRRPPAPQPFLRTSRHIVSGDEGSHTTPLSNDRAASSEKDERAISKPWEHS